MMDNPEQRKAADEAPRDSRAKPPPRTAGPHAAPELTDYDKTPGSGMLPDSGDPNVSPSS
jgi:hypothetical protein